MSNDKLQTISNLFEGKEIRSFWNAKEEYYFSVVDVISALIDSKILKKYLTDILDTKGILRLIESVPSPKTEPFKLWIAKIGSDRIVKKIIIN